MANFRTIRRTMKIWRQVATALYPFEDTSPVVFDAKGRIVSPGKDAIFDTKGEIVGYKDKKRSFCETVLRQFPPATIRRFIYFCKSESEPTDEEFKNFRRQLLGTARRTLLQVQIARIKKLPNYRLPGRGRGVSTQELTGLRNLYEKLRREGGESGEPLSKTQAVKKTADRKGYTERQMWNLKRRWESS